MVATVLAGVVAFAAPHPCRAPIPRGPALPAPVVLWTSCGGFRVAADGDVARLPRHWLARHGGGTGRRWEAKVDIVRNHARRYLLVRGGRVLWRSRDRYPGDGGSVAFGPGEFAFAAFHRGVFLTDLRGGEQLVVHGRGLFPYAFTKDGDLIVGAGRTIVVVARSGRTLRRFHIRVRSGFAFDEHTDTLFFVTPAGRLALLRERHVRVARPVGAYGSVSAPQHGVLSFARRNAITLTRRDGSVVARSSVAPGSSSDSGVSIAPDGRAAAFRTSNSRPGSKAGRASVYLLRAGATRATLLYRHRLGPSGCAVGANLSWHGRFLLYSSVDGRRAVIETSSGRVTDLRHVAHALPVRARTEVATVAWAADFR
jgi:hypothetical protein